MDRGVGVGVIVAASVIAVEPIFDVSALEKILDESSSAPVFRCKENGPSETVRSGARSLPPLPAAASGFEFSSEVVNCNLG